MSATVKWLSTCSRRLIPMSLGLDPFWGELMRQVVQKIVLGTVQISLLKSMYNYCCVGFRALASVLLLRHKDVLLVLERASIAAEASPGLSDIDVTLIVSPSISSSPEDLDL